MADLRAQLPQLPGRDHHLPAGRDDVLDHQHAAPGHLGAVGQPTRPVRFRGLPYEGARKAGMPGQRGNDCDAAHLQAGQYWTLLDSDWQLVANKSGATRLGFVALLKYFEIEGRFPQYAAEVTEQAVSYLAEQVKVEARLFAKYEWSGRTIEYHRAQIRAALGFRECSEADQEELAGWLARELCPDEQRREQLRDAVLDQCRVLRMEPPAFGQIGRLVGSALTMFELHYPLLPMGDETAGVFGRSDRLQGLSRAASPCRDQRREGEVELAGIDGGQVRVDLGVVGQPGGEQLGADHAHRRGLQPVAGYPADREAAGRRDIDQAGRTQRPRQRTAVAQVSAAAGHQLPDGAPQPVGALLCRANLIEAGQRLQLGVGILYQ
jgi:hypothetical protein